VRLVVAKGRKIRKSSLRRAMLAPGMQYHRDDSADGGNQDCSGDPHANSREVPRRRWRLEKRKLAALAGCCCKIYSLSALGTLSLHTSLPPKWVASRLIYSDDGAQPIFWPWARSTGHWLSAY